MVWACRIKVTCIYSIEGRVVMGKYMTPEDATLVGNFSEYDEDDEYLASEPYYECDLCGAELFDNYCDDCEEYIE